MKLKGDKNQCQGCREYFNSMYAFDKHRVGKHGVDRKCLTTYEMTELGMFVNVQGFWVSGPHTRVHVLKGEESNEDLE